MKRASRITLKGSVQSMFIEQFIKDNADRIGVKGFIRKLEDGRVEIFIEGDGEKVTEMTEVCKKGPQHAQIRSVDEKEEHFQSFKDFKILRV